MALRRTGRCSKLEKLLTTIERLMEQNSELTSNQIKDILERVEVIASARTIRRGRQSLGWTYQRAHYCQLIRSVNVQKRLAWATANVGDDFCDVIWTDETTVQLESHKQYSCRRKGCTSVLKPRPKHPPKTHVWAGISWEGATAVWTFSETMTAQAGADLEI